MVWVGQGGSWLLCGIGETKGDLGTSCVRSAIGITPLGSNRGVAKVFSFHLCSREVSNVTSRELVRAQYRVDRLS